MDFPKMNPRASKLSKQDKEQKVLTSAILTVDKYGIRNPNEFFSHSDTMIYLVTLFDIRNDKKMIEVEKIDEDGTKSTTMLTKKAVMTLMAKYIKKNIPSEYYFYIENKLLEYAQEIIDLHDEAVKGLPEYYEQHPESKPQIGD